MYAEAPVLQAPNWPQQARQRLRVSMLLSTIFIATILTVLRFPVAQQTRPFAELLVQILVEEVESVVQPTNTDTISGEKIDEAILSPVPERVEERSEPTTGFPDWYAQIPAAASAALDHAPRTYSVNPAFDKKRRQAAIQFAPSEAPVTVPIWENVEKDTLGRSVLWSGDCYRVLDDPNVGSRDAFLVFGQLMTMCMNWKDSPKELPWVNEIRNRRAVQARYGPPAAE